MVTPDFFLQFTLTSTGGTGTQVSSWFLSIGFEEAQALIIHEQEGVLPSQAFSGHTFLASVVALGI